MQLQLQRELLLEPLQKVVNVVQQKQTLPILGFVLIEIKDNILYIRGSDGEIELVSHSALETDAEPVSMTLPAKKLVEICRALPEKSTITLTRIKSLIKLESGKSRFMLATLPPEEYPASEEHAVNAEFTIPQQELLFLLNRTAFSIATNDVRHYMVGLLIELSSKTLTTVATDGHRLAFCAVDCAFAPEYKLQVILPRKSTLELQRLLHEPNEDITISLCTNAIKATTKSFVMTSKLIEGRFPDYQHVIPKNPEKSFVIDRDTFKNALVRSAVLCHDQFKAVRIEFGEDLLTITTHNSQNEAVNEELEIDCPGEKERVGFNVLYMIEILNVLNPGMLRIGIKHSGGSVLVSEDNSENDNFFVLMPVHL